MYEHGERNNDMFGAGNYLAGRLPRDEKEADKPRAAIREMFRTAHRLLCGTTRGVEAFTTNGNARLIIRRLADKTAGFSKPFERLRAKDWSSGHFPETGIVTLSKISEHTFYRVKSSLEESGVIKSFTVNDNYGQTPYYAFNLALIFETILHSYESFLNTAKIDNVAPDAYKRLINNRDDISKLCNNIEFVNMCALIEEISAQSFKNKKAAHSYIDTLVERIYSDKQESVSEVYDTHDVKQETEKESTEIKLTPKHCLEVFNENAKKVFPDMTLSKSPECLKAANTIITHLRNYCQMPDADIKLMFMQFPEAWNLYIDDDTHKAKDGKHYLTDGGTYAIIENTTSITYIAKHIDGIMNSFKQKMKFKSIEDKEKHDADERARLEAEENARIEAERRAEVEKLERQKKEQAEKVAEQEKQKEREKSKQDYKQNGPTILLTHFNSASLIHKPLLDGEEGFIPDTSKMSYDAASKLFKHVKFDDLDTYKNRVIIICKHWPKIIGGKEIKGKLAPKYPYFVFFVAHANEIARMTREGLEKMDKQG